MVFNNHVTRTFQKERFNRNFFAEYWQTYSPAFFSPSLPYTLSDV
jgi:hypothetical protein